MQIAFKNKVRADEKVEHTNVCEHSEFGSQRSQLNARGIVECMLSDEGCFTTQKLNFLRSHQLISRVLKKVTSGHCSMQ